MTDLFWPGDERAGGAFSQEAFLDAMVRVEEAWLVALATAGIAPDAVRVPLAEVVSASDLEAVAVRAEGIGNPVSALVALLRERLATESGGEAARWLHRGLTSQDVVDTALVICLADTVAEVLGHLHHQSHALEHLCVEHRDELMTGRTLTQSAVPITFGLKAATWLNGLSAAAEALLSLGYPAQAGGAVGTLAATVELAALRGVEDPSEAARGVLETFAETLDLSPVTPWHTERSAITVAGDALVAAADAWGRIAGDVATLSRPEIGELREGAGGGSSTMPHKSNPVLSTLLTRHALTTPGLAATLHVAAGAYVDERPAGAWHAEWDALRTLARRTLVAASQASDLLDGLVVDVGRMTANVQAAADDLAAEQASMAAFVEAEPSGTYLGLAEQLIAAAIERSGELWSELHAELPEEEHH